MPLELRVVRCGLGQLAASSDARERGAAVFGEGGLGVYSPLLQATHTLLLTAEQNAQLRRRGVVIDAVRVRVVAAAAFQHRRRDFESDDLAGAVAGADFFHGQVVAPALATVVVNHGLGVGRSHLRPPVHGVFEGVQPSSERVYPVDIIGRNASRAVRVLENVVDESGRARREVRQLGLAAVPLRARRLVQRGRVVRRGTDGVVRRGAAVEVVGSGAAVEVVWRGAAVEVLGRGAAVEVMERGAAVEVVGGGAAVEVVGSGAAVEVVGRSAAVEVVGRRAAVEVVVGRTQAGGNREGTRGVVRRV